MSSTRASFCIALNAQGLPESPETFIKNYGVPAAPAGRGPRSFQDFSGGQIDLPAHVGRWRRVPTTVVGNYPGPGV